MSIDLEAFREAAANIRMDIWSLRHSGDASALKRTLEWMLVQIDDLTKKVAELEKK